MQLNPSQQQAIDHDQGPLLIIAGAGTGKTRVISERFCHLLQSKKLKTDNILCLTYTEKGAEEMENRIEENLPNSHNILWIHTFHSFAQRILKNYGHEIGLASKQTILQGAERWIFIRDNLDSFDLDYYKPIASPTNQIHNLLKFFDTLKSENISHQSYIYALEKRYTKLEEKKYECIGDEYEAEKEDIQKQTEAVKAFKTYNLLMQKHGYLDYGDLINNLHKLLSTRKSVLVELQKQFQYILIDEYQDTNGIQNAILQMLASAHQNITVVGDDDQSIFRFQGASIKNILEFTNNHKDTKTLVLTNNYRSNQPILDASYTLVQHNNPYRLESKQNINKKLISNTATSSKLPKILAYQTHIDEVHGIVQSIQELLQSGILYKDIAILYRSHAHSEGIIEGLKNHNLPFQVIEGSGLFKRREIRDLFAILRSIADPQDNVSMFRFLSLEIFGINPTILLQISNFAKSANMPIIRVIEEKLNEVLGLTDKNGQDTLFSLISNEDRDQIQSFLQFFNSAVKQQFTLSASLMIEYILQESGWLETLNAEKNIEDIQIRANLIKILRKAQNFEYSHTNVYLSNFIDHLTDLEEAGENPEQATLDTDANEDAITLMTIHKSKGLEWKAVFIISCVERKFPSDNRRDPIPVLPELLGGELPDKDMHVQEERRLMYVAMTRAKERLYMTYAKNYGGKRDSKPSRFLGEIGDEGERLEMEIGDRDREGDWKKGGGKKVTEVPKNVELKKKGHHLHLPIVQRNMYLNYSGMSTFTKCPLQFKYKNILQIPVYKGAAGIFGSYIHDVLEFLYKNIQMGKTPSLNEVIEYYEDNWKPYGFLSKEQQLEYHTKGKEMIGEYYALHKADFRKPLFLERGFKVKVGDFTVSGFIDRVDKISDDKCEIIDYKTGKPQTLQKLQKDKTQLLQLYIYSIAAQDLWNLNPWKLSLYYLENQTKISITPTPEDLALASEYIQEIGKEIMQSNFEGKPNEIVCKYCDYKKICPSRAK